MIIKIKARIDKTPQNSKCRLCGDRDATIDHIISECNKLAEKEYNTRQDWVGKVIHWDMCKKFEFHHTNKWYMHNPASVLEYDTQTPLGFWHTERSPNFRQKTRSINNQQKKRICKIVDFAVPADHRIKLKEWEKKDKYLDLAREWKKKLWNMKVKIVPLVIGAFGTGPKGLLKELEDLEVRGRVETIQSTALLRTSEYWGESLRL